MASLQIVAFFDKNLLEKKFAENIQDFEIFYWCLIPIVVLTSLGSYLLLEERRQIISLYLRFGPICCDEKNQFIWACKREYRQSNRATLKNCLVQQVIWKFPKFFSGNWKMASNQQILTSSSVWMHFMVCFFIFSPQCIKKLKKANLVMLLLLSLSSILSWINLPFKEKFGFIVYNFLFSLKHHLLRENGKFANIRGYSFLITKFFQHWVIKM